MQSNLVAVAAGGFISGALYAWAFTADYFEAKNKRQSTALREMMRGQSKTFAQINEERRQRANVLDQDTRVDILDGSIAPMTASEIYENSKNLIGTEIAPDEDEITEEDPIPPGETPEQTETKLRGLINEYTVDREAVDQWVELAGKTLEFQDLPPYVISAERWAYDPDDGDDYAKEHLDWYPITRVLITEDGDPIKEVGLKIGWDSVRMFGDESGHPNLVYVRNPRELTDYEVERHDEDPPEWIQLGMTRTEYETHKAAGNLRPPRKNQ